MSQPSCGLRPVVHHHTHGYSKVVVNPHLTFKRGVQAPLVARSMDSIDVEEDLEPLDQVSSPKSGVKPDQSGMWLVVKLIQNKINSSFKYGHEGYNMFQEVGKGQNMFQEVFEGL